MHCRRVDIDVRPWSTIGLTIIAWLERDASMTSRFLGNCIAMSACLCVGGVIASLIWLLVSFPLSKPARMACIVVIAFDVGIGAVAMWKRHEVARSFFTIPLAWRRPLLLASALSLISTVVSGLLGHFAIMMFSMGIVPMAFYYLRMSSATHASESIGAEDDTSL